MVDTSTALHLVGDTLAYYFYFSFWRHFATFAEHESNVVADKVRMNWRIKVFQLL